MARHVALSSFTLMGRPAIPEVSHAVEELALHRFAQQAAARAKSAGAVATDPIAWGAPAVLGAIIHNLRQDGSSEDQGDAARLQASLEVHAERALRDQHTSEHQRIWLTALGNTHHPSIVPVVDRFVNASTEQAPVHAKAVHALRGITHDRVTATLRSALQDARPAVRASAVRSVLMHRRKPEELGMLAEAMVKEEDPHVLGTIQLATGLDLLQLREKAWQPLGPWP